MYDYNTKDQSIRIPSEGLVNWHPEGGIRNANVLSATITLYVPSKTAKNMVVHPNKAILTLSCETSSNLTNQ